MPITNHEKWNRYVEINDDPYGKACVDVARRVMELLDEGEEFDCHEVISKADEETEVGGITGFMAGCVAELVSICHSRGEEFRRKWNIDTQISSEGDAANESGGVLNPAVLSIRV